jgi:hypothetical protein
VINAIVIAVASLVIGALIGWLFGTRNGQGEAVADSLRITLDGVREDGEGRSAGIRCAAR